MGTTGRLTLPHPQVTDMLMLMGWLYEEGQDQRVAPIGNPPPRLPEVAGREWLGRTKAGAQGWSSGTAMGRLPCMR